jgi:hypothetical protein
MITTTLGDIFNHQKELISLIEKFLNPLHTTRLRAVSKTLHANLPMKALEAKAQEILATCTRAVQLPSGAHRLHSRFGEHTMDAALPLFTMLMFPELAYTRNGPQYGPPLHVRLDGVEYIARVWPNTDVADGRTLWPSTQDLHVTTTDESNRLFRISSTILQELAGGAWISRVNHNVAYYGTPNLTCTTIHLTLHKSYVMVDGGAFKLQLVCTPIGV